MALLTGMTEDGLEVPVQVDASGRLVAEGLQGPPGADAQDLWNRTGTEISPKSAGDAVFTSGAVKIGGTTAAPNITLGSNGTGNFNVPIGSMPGIVNARASTTTGDGLVSFSVNTAYTGRHLHLYSATPSSAAYKFIYCANATREAFSVFGDGLVHAPGIADRVYADNNAATAAGLRRGDLYRKADGTVMVKF